MYSTKLFAEKVMPQLRNMFPEYADDDRFWCHPIDKRGDAGQLPRSVAQPLLRDSGRVSD